MRDREIRRLQARCWALEDAYPRLLTKEERSANVNERQTLVDTILRLLEGHPPSPMTVTVRYP